MLKSTLRIALGAIVLSFLAAGCDKGVPDNACTKNGAMADLSGNHGHAIDVPADHVKRGIGGTYAVRGGEHEHVIVLKDEDMKKIQRAESVKTRTSSVNGHVHEVEVKCK